MGKGGQSSPALWREEAERGEGRERLVLWGGGKRGGRGGSAVFIGWRRRETAWGEEGKGRGARRPAINGGGSTEIKFDD
jgi:hypothetical protein